MINTTCKQSQSASLKSRSLRALLAAPAIALAVAVAPAPSPSQHGAEVAALSKRFMRFNEYLFNGVQHGTAIATIQYTACESHV